MWQESQTKMWSAETIDLEHSKCTTYDPESTARALQSTILEKLSKSVMYEMLGTDLTIEITIEILPEVEAKRLLNDTTEISLDY